MQFNEHLECTLPVLPYSNVSDHQNQSTTMQVKGVKQCRLGGKDETFFLGTAMSSIAGAMAAPSPGSTRDWASGRGAGGGVGMRENPEGIRGNAAADAARRSQPAAAAMSPSGVGGLEQGGFRWKFPDPVSLGTKERSVQQHWICWAGAWQSN
jgi:hypothetical protein